MNKINLKDLIAQTEEEMNIKGFKRVSKKTVKAIVSAIKGKTLIGTCGGQSPCEYWENDITYGEYCHNPKMRMSGKPEKDFGCIHWQEKKND